MTATTIIVVITDRSFSPRLTASPSASSTSCIPACLPPPMLRWPAAVTARSSRSASGISLACLAVRALALWKLNLSSAGTLGACRLIFMMVLLKSTYWFPRASVPPPASLRLGHSAPDTASNRPPDDVAFWSRACAPGGRRRGGLGGRVDQLVPRESCQVGGPSPTCMAQPVEETHPAHRQSLQFSSASTDGIA